MTVPQPTSPATSGASKELSTTDKPLTTGEGKISVADSVVTKIAGLAAREVSGVHSMGGGASRAFSAIKQRIPGSSGPQVTQGVSVEVGETQAAIDLDLIVEYGVSIADLGRAIQKNVKNSVEKMTGLQVVEVNVTVDDVYLGETEDSSSESEPARVQ